MGKVHCRFAIIIIVLSLHFSAAGRVAAEDWSQFLGPNRNGAYSGTALSESWPNEGPPIRWQREVGQGFSGPVISNNQVILFHRRGNEEVVEKLEGASGKQIWKFSYPTSYQDDFGFDEGPRATPAINENRVYVFGAEGFLHCLDFSTGKRIWAISCKDQFKAAKGFFGMVCSPLIEGGKVLLNIGGANGAGMVAFNSESGKLEWKSGNDEASYSSPVAATIHGKRYALFLTRSGLVALEPGNGHIDIEYPWRSRSHASVNAATPLVIGDKIFLSASYETGAVLLELTNHQARPLWSTREGMSNHYATSIYYEDNIFGFDGRQEEKPALACISAKTGQTRWRKEHFGSGTITLVGNRLLILTEGGEVILAATDPANLKIIARAQVLPSGIRAYPALANARLYARSKDHLYCVDLEK